MKISVIIAAGGRSSRMNGKNKLTEIIGGLPLIARTTAIFDGMEEISGIIVPAAAEHIEEYETIFSSNKISEKARIIKGGNTRIIRDCIEAAAEHGACCAAVPVSDTIKEVDRKGFVKKTLDRERLYRIQTPQAFIYKDILKLHKKAMFRSLKVTDDAQIAEYFGYSVYLVKSEYSNMKITTETDLVIANALLTGGDYAGAHDPLAAAEV